MRLIALVCWQSAVESQRLFVLCGGLDSEWPEPVGLAFRVGRPDISSWPVRAANVERQPCNRQRSSDPCND